VTDPKHNKRGILAMLAAMALFVVNDVFVRLASVVYPTGQIMALRGIFSSLIMVGVAIYIFRRGELIGAMRHPSLALRAGLEAISALTFITSLALLSLPIVTAITQASPLMLTAISVMLGMERVGWRRWIATLIGFIGVLIVLRPGADGLQPAAMLALVCALAIALRDLVTRRMPASIPSLAIAVSTTVTVMIAGFALALVETWQPLQLRETLYLLGAGLFVASGNFAIVLAFRDVDMSVVGPFRYSILAWAMIAGFMVWDDWPDRLALLGMGLIVASGLYIVHRERVKNSLRQVDKVEKPAF
jgi:drug/metabolite transporter (DMT)-like permease